MYWAYQAISTWGETIKGSYRGSFADCLKHIRLKECTVLSVYPDWSSWWLGQQHKVVSNQQLIVMFDDLYHLLNSGMPLPKALEMMGSLDNADSRLWQMVSATMVKGASFAQAIRSTQAFPLFVGCCIDAAERSGLLVEVLKYLAESCKQHEEHKGSFFQALMYPSIVFVLLAGIASFIAVTVVPQIKSLLPQEKLSDPLTYYSLGFLQSVYCYGLYVLVALIVTVVSIVLLIRKYPDQSDRVIFKLPLVGNIIKEMRLAVLLVQLTMLIKSGFSVIDSIKQVNEIFNNSMTRRLFHCRSYMISGLSVANAIKKDSFFPIVLVQAIERAEQSVAWEQYLSGCAQYFQRKSRRDFTTVINLVSPLMLAIAGLFLMAVGLGFLLPIYGNLVSIAGN